MEQRQKDSASVWEKNFINITSKNLTSKKIFAKDWHFSTIGNTGINFTIPQKITMKYLSGVDESKTVSATITMRKIIKNVEHILDDATKNFTNLTRIPMKIIVEYLIGQVYLSESRLYYQLMENPFFDEYDEAWFGSVTADLNDL